MPTSTRDRMVVSAAELIRTHGATATTIDRVLADSAAPRGSVYHHFPGGRAQLITEAVALAAVHGAGPLGATRLPEPAPNPLDVLDAVIETWRRRLVGSEFRAGCTVLAVAVEGRDALPEAYATAAAALTAWRARLAGLLEAHGVDHRHAHDLATLTVASIEGAIVLSRTDASLAPLEIAAGFLRGLLAAALEEVAA